MNSRTGNDMLWVNFSFIYCLKEKQIFELEKLTLKINFNINKILMHFEVCICILSVDFTSMFIRKCHRHCRINNINNYRSTEDWEGEYQVVDCTSC